MSDLFDFVREYLVGEKPSEPERSRAALDSAVNRYTRRMASIRALSWFQVALSTAFFFFGIWLLFTADGASSPREVGIALAIFLFGGIGVMFGKTALLISQYHTATQKELKRIQIRVLDVAEAVEVRDV